MKSPSKRPGGRGIVVPEESEELFRKRDGYSIFFVPYSVSETGVKVEYHGVQPEIAKKGVVWSFTVEHEQMQDFQADLKEAIAKRQCVSLPVEQPQ